MQLIEKEKELVVMAKNFERGILDNHYEDTSKRILIEFMFDKTKYIADKFGKSYSFEMETGLEQDKVKIVLEKETFNTEIINVFNYMVKAVSNNRKSFISNLMESKDKESFYEKLNLINNT